MPAAVANAPELHWGLHIYWLAFAELSTCRPIPPMGGMLPLKMIDVIDYARAFDFTESQTEDLMYFVRKMDSAFMKHFSDKEKKRQKRDGNKQKSEQASGTTKTPRPGLGGGC